MAEPDVEENSLAAQIYVLRKVFGADRHLIRTVAGRGYQFTGEIRATSETAAGPAPSRMTNLPETVSELIGREAELGAVTALATEHRLVSLVGRFRLLTGGRRTLPRHQTMRATLDWSYELLSESERVVLRRLGVFVGAFTLDAASAVAASADIPASEVADSVVNLVGKSLVSTDVGGAMVHYRLRGWFGWMLANF